MAMVSGRNVSSTGRGTKTPRSLGGGIEYSDDILY